MARPRGRPKKGKPLATRNLAMRVTDAYAAWLAEAAAFDRMKIPTFIDRAVADRAKMIGFPKPPPERIP
jgi:hypothetical protein